MINMQVSIIESNEISCNIIWETRKWFTVWDTVKSWEKYWKVIEIFDSPPRDILQLKLDSNFYVNPNYEDVSIIKKYDWKIIECNI